MINELMAFPESAQSLILANQFWKSNTWIHFSPWKKPLTQWVHLYNFFITLHAFRVEEAHPIKSISFCLR